jgi:peptide/nickel transport system permease protein
MPHLINMKRVIKYIPGLDAEHRSGIVVIFSLFFYLSLLVTLLRHDRCRVIAADSGIDGILSLCGIFAALVVLYLGTTLLPRISRTYETRGSRFAKRFAANKTAIAGLALILGILLVTVFGPIIAPFEPATQSGTAIERYQSPSSSHFMGTDKFGRDIFSRVLYGARISMSVGLLAVLISCIVGIGIGVAAGFFGGVTDEVLMRFTDGLLAFPRILLVLLLVALFSNSYLLIILVIACTSWMGIARLVRAELLSLREREFIQAAVASGVSRARMVWNHLLPNALGPVIVAATLQIGTVILLESTLSFLGVGVQPPTPSWGQMVFEGRDALLSAWWVAAAPGAAIMTAVISFNLLGDGLRDAMEPRESVI